MPIRLLLAVVGGTLIWVSFPGIDAWYAAPVGVALLALSTRGAGLRAGALLGLVGGLAYLMPLLSWTGIYVGSLPWVALSVLSALYVAGYGALTGALRVSDRGFPLLVACAWVALELARSTTPYGGFPWGRLAFGQSTSPYARVAALAGAPGVTFAVALTGGFLALALYRLFRRTGGEEPSAADPTRRPSAPVRRPQHRRTRAVGLCLAGALVALALPLAIPLPTEGPTAHVTAIQGNVPQAGLDFNAQRRAVLDNHAEVTKAASAQQRRDGLPTPDLIVWPENASDIDPLRNPDAADVIRAAVRDAGAPVLVGAVLNEPEPYVSNATLLYLPGGDGPSARYVKRHPVPMAEYIPHRSFYRLFSDKVDLVTRDFTAGAEVGVLRVPRAGGAPEVAAGINICFEVAYDDLVRDGVQAGANLIVVQTNNATFGRTAESVQQLAISRIRAIEHGRSVVHISNVGVSSLITPDGVAHGWTSLFTADVLRADLPLRAEQTLATRLGDLPAYLTTAALGAWVAFGLVRARRRAADLRRDGALGSAP